MKRLFKGFVVTLAALMTTACLFTACAPSDTDSSGNSVNSSSSGSADTDKMVTTISITNKPQGNSIDVGESVTLGYAVEPADATNVSVTWSSSDDKVATVDANGKVTGVAAGSVVITAKVKGTEISAKAPLSVRQPVVPKPIENISLTGLEANTTMKRGETKQVTLTATPSDCDPYEVEWTYDSEILEIIESVDGFSVVAIASGTTDVTVTVKGTEIHAEASVTVAGDVDYAAGVATETFSRGAIDPNGVYYTSADKTTSVQKPMYNGAFFKAGARSNTTTPADLGLKDGALEWTIHTPENFERVTFYYTGEIDSASKYLVRIPVTAASVTEEAAIRTKLYYGYRVKSGDDLGLSYNNTAAPSDRDNSMKYHLNIGGEALGQFTQVGETVYLEVRVASGWNGEVWVSCHGGQNKGVVTGKLTVTFDNIQVLKVSDLEYPADVETFEAATDAGAGKVGTTASSAMLNVAATGDRVQVDDLLQPRECGPATDVYSSTGKLLKWTTNRVYKEGAALPAGDSHQKILFTFKNIDPAKGYTIEIPLLACLTDPNVKAFKIEDLKIKAYSADTADAGKLLAAAEKPFAHNGDKAVLRLTVAPGSEWGGVICVRIYNDKIEQKADSTKLELYFDNIILKEGNA